MVFQREDWMDTLTSSLMLSSHPMDNSVFPVHGTVPSDFGILPLVTPPEDSLATPRYVDMDFSWRDSYSMTCNLYVIIFLFRTFSPSPSPLTTVKLSPLLATAPSNCGTLWVFASTPSKNKVTPNGFPVFDSPHWPKTQSLFHLVGINWSRSGIFPTANSSVITTATLATWTPLLSLQMVPSVLLVVVMVPPNCGIWALKRPSHSTLWTLVMKSMLFPSHQTDTGSVLPLVPLSRSGIWNKRSSLKNSNQKSWDTRKVPHQYAPPSAGHPMDKPSSPDTLITSSVSGHSLFHVPLPKCRPVRDSNLSVWKIGRLVWRVRHWQLTLSGNTLKI